MFTVIVSNCQGKAINRSRNILDQYAFRLNKNTWHSKMTMDGLSHLKSELNAIASKNTSVYCYINDGMDNLKLAWRVGSSKQIVNKQCAIFTTQDLPSYRSNVSKIARVTSLLLRIAGYSHDIGKATVLFQRKLKSQTRLQKDPYRHEWISTHILQQLRAGKDWGEAWNTRIPTSMPSFMKGFSNVQEVVDYCVCTHHGLVGSPTDTQSTDSHVRLDVINKTNKADLIPVEELDSGLISKILKSSNRLSNLVPTGSPLYYDGLATITRPLLIMADHVISSRTMEGDNKVKMYANTKDGKVDQPLGWHLLSVGDLAAWYSYQLHTNFKLPSLSDSAKAIILQPGNDAKYQWQDQAVTAIEQSNADNMLVFIVADTGAGKTLSNLKSATVLRKLEDCRVSVVLNLKTLTLQTGVKYDALLGNTREVVTVIGDTIVQRLHEFHDADENEEEGDVEVFGELLHDTLPDWINEFTTLYKKSSKILNAPLLVSTIDYIINAGDPDQQGNHVTSFLRVASSDLVIDEIDGYDPTQIIAICRVVELAAIFGRNVICSSATLAKSIAHTVHQAFLRGTKIRRELFEVDTVTKIGFIDNNVSPLIQDIDLNIDKMYMKFIRDKSNVVRDITKLAKVLDMPKYPTRVHLEHLVRSSIQELHNDFHTVINGKRVSVGLIRIANIKKAAPLARKIAKRFDANVHVCCYHSQDTVINRFYKEQQLDLLLTRHQGVNNWESIIPLIDVSTHTNVIFLVVATPVEEIGRDHDFDWAIIEPSSIQSIIQTSGRINRHRELIITNPNIHILPYNYNFLYNDALVFTRPGVEKRTPSGTTHPNYDMKHLLPVDNEGKVVISSALRSFNDTHCMFALYDDNSISEDLKEGAKVFFGQGYNRTYHKHQYIKYTLRDIDRKEHWIWEDNDYKLQDGVYKTNHIEVLPKVNNDWLSLTYSQSIDLCNIYHIKSDFGMRVSVNAVSSNLRKINHDLSFGFFENDYRK